MNHILTTYEPHINHILTSNSLPSRQKNLRHPLRLRHRGNGRVVETVGQQGEGCGGPWEHGAEISEYLVWFPTNSLFLMWLIYG